MFNVVLVHPEIPPNTGNVIRLCANTGASLHLIRPLGFSLEIHDNWEAFLAAEHPNPERMFAMTTKGSTVFSQLKFMPGDWFIFGAEGSGLPDDIRSAFSAHNRIRLPMRPDNRSLNLSNAVAVTVFEAWRQQNYAGGC